MSKRQFKSQASSGRVGGGFGAFGGGGFGSAKGSVLSYVQEPPEYSSISDANTVVAFKNLSKKDSTTKAKALEDLQSNLVGPDAEVEEAILESWVSVSSYESTVLGVTKFSQVKLFPRLSIDSARRVRQLTHGLNSQLCAKCGKRVAKYLPKITGPWLAGSYDVDRAAAKAAQDGLSLVFPSADKIQGLKKTFQESILEYCQSAILDETVKTLSDERSVSLDDANAVFARVVSTGLAVITDLLDTLPATETSKQSHVYEAILSDSKLWSFVHHPDSTVRRSMHRLVRVCLKRDADLVTNNIKEVSHAYIYKGLPSDQTGSANDFAETLNVLTTTYPHIWTDAYSGKKSALSRLQTCLQHGSYAGPPSYWTSLSHVIQKLPVELLPKANDAAADLLSAAKTGITRKEERLNSPAAWAAYFTLLDRVTFNLPDEDSEAIIEAFAMPPLNQYIHPEEDSASWAVAGNKPAAALSQVALVRRLPPLLERKWSHLAKKLIESAKMSQPEQSKDFAKSQSLIAASGERWANLQQEFFNGSHEFPESTKSVFVQANLDVLRECRALLQTRNGKPYGAAAVIAEQLKISGRFLMQDTGFATEVKQFIVQDIPTLIISPSHRYLAFCLFAIASEPEFEEVMNKTLETLLNSDQDNAQKAHSIHALFPRSAPSEALKISRENHALQDFFVSYFSSGTSSQLGSIFPDLLRVGVVSNTSSDSVLSKLTESISLSDSGVESGLQAIEQLTTTNLDVIQAFVAGGAGERLLPSVLKLEQSPDDAVAERATKLSTRLTSNLGEAATDAKFSVIRQNLEEVSHTSLSIDTVIELSQNLLKEGIDAESMDKILPSEDIWIESIMAAIKPPKLSLSLVNPLGGAVRFVLPGTMGQGKTVPVVRYDSDGLSQALRIAMYVIKILEHDDVFEKLGSHRAMLLTLLDICSLASEDNLSILGANNLWNYNDNAALETELIDFVSEANTFHRRYIIEKLTPESAFKLADHNAGYVSGFGVLQSAHVHTPLTFYASLGDCRARQAIFDIHGHDTENAKAAEERLKKLRLSKEPSDLTCCLVGFAQPLQGTPTLTRFCNELVADLTALDLESNPHKGMELLVMLNAILHTQDDIIDTIAKSRLIFMIKHAISWLASKAPTATKAEVFRALTMLLPGYQDMYGEHWAQIVTSMIDYWASAGDISDGQTVSESGIVMMHQSLRLHNALDKVSQIDDANDDLLETLKENRDKIYDGLTSILKFASGVADETHQPLMITNELLARQISRLPNRPLHDTEDFFSLLYTPSKAIQGAAFDLLHKHIPAAQEQISFDAALDNKTAELPDELLSLIIEAPTLDSLADASFERSMPSSLQGFLYSWRLVFDHFNGSSFKVKTDYIEQLKEGGYLNGLLDLTFNFLGHTRGRPIDASKFDIGTYSPYSEDRPEKDVQYLLTHLYYLALLHVPNLVKAQFLELRSRQTSMAVETWTAKYISPLIITASLQGVAEWAEKSVREDPEYENMTVRVSSRSREINVSYLVDEQAMAIRVVLPDAYPLAYADVQSVSQVAVKDEKWQSWLRNCRGVIAFSNGSITDGLSAWRKNVVGTLKGQTECAICYSIISGDKQLPTKRCPTCKNLFHSSCLYKWFKTSNASTCPLCRNPFNFN